MENLSRVRFSANASLDDLLEQVEGEKRLKEMGILNGWRTIIEGHRKASEGNWREAVELIETGERMIENVGSPEPNEYVWQNVRGAYYYVI